MKQVEGHVEAAWSEWVAAFNAAQKLAGSAPATVETQVKAVRRFARHSRVHPREATRGMILSWIEALPGSPDTVKRHRMSLRAFYRWAVANRLVAVDPMPASAPARRYTIDARWQDALNAFEAADATSGISAGTIENRMKHLARLAIMVEVSPWAVTSDDLLAWLDGLACARRTREAHRVSVTAFYRWAEAHGRVRVNPALWVNRRRTQLPNPELWHESITSFQTHLRAGGRSENTVRLYVSILRKFAREHERADPFSLTIDDLAEWFGGKRWQVETRRSAQGAVRLFYRWAEETDRVDASPAEHLPTIRAASPLPRPALESEYRAALRRANDRERRMLRLAAELGLRRGEVAQVHSRDVYDVDGFTVLTVRGKGNKVRTLPLPDSLRRDLASVHEGYLFPGQMDGHLSPGTVGTIISRLLPPRVSMHALRHRFATLAYGVHRDVFAVQQLLGHSSPSTTQRYVQVSHPTMRELVDAVQETSRPLLATV